MGYYPEIEGKRVICLTQKSSSFIGMTLVGGMSRIGSCLDPFFHFLHSFFRRVEAAILSLLNLSIKNQSK